MNRKFQKSILTVFLLCTVTLIYSVKLAQAEPREILTSWEDIEVYDINSPSKYANPDANQGGKIRLTTTGTYDNFHIFATRGRAAHHFFYTYESLGETLPGVSNVLRGALAESFDLSEDRTELRVKIHPLAKFADGSKVRAQDVVFTFTSLKEKGNPLYLIGFTDVLELKAESDDVVYFKFREGASRELPLEVCQLPVFAEAWWEGRDFSEPQYEPILASGAYQVKSKDFGARFSLAKNPDYWGKDLPRNQGRYNFDEIIIDYYRDATIAREAFFAGEVDYYVESTIKDWENAYDVESVRNGSIRRFSYDSTSTLGMMGLAMNTRRPVLADQNVRRALILMMDFEWINKTMYYDTYKRIDQYFVGYGYTLDSKPNQEELVILNELKDDLDPAVFGDLPKISVTDGSGNLRAQMKEAVEVLKLSGYELKNGKMIDKDGKQLSLKLIASSATVQRTYGQYVQNLARIGIDLQIQLLDQNLYNSQLKTFDFDLCYVSARVGLNPGNELPHVWGSGSRDTENSNNYPGVADPAVDKLIDKMIKAQTLAELSLYTRVLDRIMLHGMYYVPGWYSPQSRIAWWVEKITPGNVDDINARTIAEYWYVPE